MIVPYDTYVEINPVIHSLRDVMYDLKFRYYASDIVERISVSGDEDRDFAVKKAMIICRLANIPVQQHFKSIYRSRQLGVERDWKLSGLAGSLVIIGWNASDDDVMEIQHALIDYLDYL